MRITTLASLAGLALCATSAHATIHIFAGPGNIQGDENVLFHGDGLIHDGLLVQGKLNQSGTIVDFFNAGTILHDNGGQAKLTALDGGTFSKLSVGLDNPQLTFSSLIYNLNAKANGKVTFNIMDVASGSLHTETFNVDKNGQNFFRIVADGNSRISLAGFTSTVGIQDVKQVRIGGVQAVPEPATMAGLALGALAVLRRRRAKKQ